MSNSYACYCCLEHRHDARSARPWSIFLSNTEITSTRADLVRAQAHPITCTSTSLFKVEGTASKPLARDVFFHPHQVAGVGSCVLCESLSRHAVNVSISLSFRASVSRNVKRKVNVRLCELPLWTISLLLLISRSHRLTWRGRYGRKQEVKPLYKCRVSQNGFAERGVG
jgi:hypothetical protein